MSDFTAIRNLVTKSETAEALQLLQEKVPTFWQSSLLLLRANLSQLEKEVMNGVTSTEEAQRRRSQLNAATLQLIEKVESDAISPESLFAELKTQFWNQDVAEENEESRKKYN